MRVVVILAGLLWGLASTAYAHAGDQLFPIFELTDDDLTQIDLEDGSVEDWENIFGDPTMTAVDFPIDLNSPESEYDPSDIDFRIWLGWNQTTSRIYMAVESIDDDYFNEYKGLTGLNFMTYYDSIQLMVDGDHSGGPYNYGVEETLTTEEEKLIFQVGAQHYAAIAQAPDTRYVNLLRLNEWCSLPPYVDGKGTVLGTAPAISVIEFFVTPFDRLAREKPEESAISKLFPGKVVGFSISVSDIDTPPGISSTIYSLTSSRSIFGPVRLAS